MPEMSLLDKGDAGEFLVQCMHLASVSKQKHDFAFQKLIDRNAKLLDHFDERELNSLLNALGQYGMSFESEVDWYGEDEAKEMALAGVEAAETFVRQELNSRKENR